MTRNAEVLEVLDNWTDTEIKDHMAELQTALDLRTDWEKLSRAEKDAAWDRAH